MKSVTIIEKNKSILKQYVIDSSVINEMIEHIRNAEIYALSARQNIYVTDSEPYACLDDDVWIGGE